ncbi:MAG: hypothetical protein GC150_17360 [Rhizobiales bacterium]|nr:hypothetical protein [Hyphomicrobiales bacterium]
MIFSSRMFHGLAVALPLCVVQPAAAVDAQGGYAARGTPAVMRCADLTRLLQPAAPAQPGVQGTPALNPAARAAQIGAFMAWVDGVLTGVNMSLPNTFDISPYRGASIVQALVVQRCAANPTLFVHQAVLQAVNALGPFRSQSDSPVVAISVNGNNLAIREDTLRQVQQALMTRGFLRAGRPDGRFTVSTRAALKRFQEAQRLPLSELPDPETLQRLAVR